MDIEKLIEQLRKSADFEDYPIVASFAAIIEKKYLRDAATALSALQAENEKLRAEVESFKKGHCAGCSIPAVKAEQIRDLTDAPKLRAELEQVKAERDAAVKDLNEFLAMDELCPIQCEWCKWKDTFCDGKTPEWRGMKED